MKSFLTQLIDNKNIAIVGFGREGQSTYLLIRKYFPHKAITIIDNNENVEHNDLVKNDENINFMTGKNCMQQIDNYDVAIKTPGISVKQFPKNMKRVFITSQTDIFLSKYASQTIGITGTKGKSTTSSLIYHIFKTASTPALLVGNIGIPPFDCVDNITPETKIVMELSSHQLQFVKHSPHIAILLNLFEEHLDHYYSFLEYQQSKFNISRFQHTADFFIYNIDNEFIIELLANEISLSSNALSFSMNNTFNSDIQLKDNNIIYKGNILYHISAMQHLKGAHNTYNIMAAATACYLSGIGAEKIREGIKTFKGLEHRIELVGTYNGIVWYNDSISTIPQATIEAVKTLKDVNTLILGGFDRGIDYSPLYAFLPQSGIKNIIWVGKAGKRMSNEFDNSAFNNYHLDSYVDIVKLCSEITEKNKICLLSPAAASYDNFKNFEERGNVFKENIKRLSEKHA